VIRLFNAAKSLPAGLGRATEVVMTGSADNAGQLMRSWRDSSAITHDTTSNRHRRAGKRLVTAAGVWAATAHPK
jgi:hypothetical protein